MFDILTLTVCIVPITSLLSMISTFKPDLGINTERTTTATIMNPAIIIYSNSDIASSNVRKSYASSSVPSSHSTIYTQ